MSTKSTISSNSTFRIGSQPYKRDAADIDGFQVWGKPPETKYTVPLGHMVNYGHYQKTEITIEQIYLSGMIASKDPKQELVPLAWSWIVPPKMIAQGESPGYVTERYDPAQKAYLLDWKDDRKELTFELVADPDYYGVASTIINPALVVKNWGRASVQLEVDDRRVMPSDKFRIGYEGRDWGTDLIVWLQLESTEPVNISLHRGLD